MITIELAQLAAVIGGQSATPAVQPRTQPKSDYPSSGICPEPLPKPPTAVGNCDALTDPVAKFYCRGGD